MRPEGKNMDELIVVAFMALAPFSWEAHAERLAALPEADSDPDVLRLAQSAAAYVAAFRQAFPRVAAEFDKESPLG